MNSKRLPGKVLKKINSKTLLQIVIDRVKKSINVDEIIVLTSINDKDNLIWKYCINNKINVFRGSEKDVLTRFYKASLKYDGTHYLRINADCPFIDWNLIDIAIKKAYSNKKLDYVSSILSNTFPIGQHVEVFRKETLNKINKLSQKDIEREHVTPYIYNNKDRFKIFSIISNNNLSYIRLTIDYTEDFIFTRELINIALSDMAPLSELIKIIISNPDILKINNQYSKSQFIDLNNK